MRPLLIVTMLVLPLLFGGCRSASDTENQHLMQSSETVPGAVLKGVVVTRFTGQMLYYQKKCESCGFVSPQTVGTGVQEAPWTCTITFVCPKCGKTTDGFIKTSH